MILGRRRGRALAGALVLLLLGRMASADELSQAVDLALARNPAVAAAGARIHAAEAGERVAYALYLPTLNATLRGGHGWEPAGLVPDGRLDSYWEGEARLELRQRLWDGGRREATLDRAEADTTAATARRARAQDELAHQVVQAYLDGAGAVQRLDLLRRALADLKGLQGLIAQQIAGGYATEADRHQLDTRLDFLAAEIARAEGERSTAEARLFSLTGESLFAFTLPPFPAARVPLDAGTALQRALAAAPLLAEARALIVAADAERAKAEAEFWPVVDFVLTGRLAQHPEGLDDSREELLAILQLRWRLYDGYGRQAFENQRTHEAAAANFQLAERQREIEGQLADALAQLTRLERRQPALDGANAAARTTYRLYREQFGIDERSLLDLVDARSELLLRSEEAVAGEIDRLRAAFDLAFAMGELRVWLAEPAGGQQTEAPSAQLASVGFPAAPDGPVTVSAAIAVVMAEQGIQPPPTPGAGELSVAPAVAGKLGDGPGLADLAQSLAKGDNR